MWILSGLSYDERKSANWTLALSVKILELPAKQDSSDSSMFHIGLLDNLYLHKI